MIVVFSRIWMQDKDGKLKIFHISINPIKSENAIIKHQLPVNNYTNIMTIITNQYSICQLLLLHWFDWVGDIFFWGWSQSPKYNLVIRSNLIFIEHLPSV